MGEPVLSPPVLLDQLKSAAAGLVKIHDEHFEELGQISFEDFQFVLGVIKEYLFSYGSAS